MYFRPTGAPRITHDKTMVILRTSRQGRALDVSNVDAHGLREPDESDATMPNALRTCGGRSRRRVAAPR